MSVLQRSPYWLPLLMTCSILSGCSRDDLLRLINKETYAFEGVYDNQYDQQHMVFKDGKVSIQDSDGDEIWIRSFELDENQLTIEMSQNSKEQRPDLILRVHGAGEVLTCSACARYQISNIWVRLGAQPRSEQAPEVNDSERPSA